jgi:signal transduction histidine kinase
MQGNIIYASDEHGSGGPGRNFRQDARQPFGGMTRPLPADYAGFLQKLNASADGRVSYVQSEFKFDSKSLIYGARLTNVALYISTPLDPVNSTTDILRTQLVYITGISLLLSLIIAFFIARKFSRPVTSISAQAGRLAKGDYNASFAKGFCSELDELSSTLDHTAVELSKVETLRRELLANISHDLRTPLTMIKAYTELIRDISGDNKQKREANLEIISRESDRLMTLVSDVLDISVLQSGSEQMKPESFNLSGTAQRVVAQFRPLCGAEGIQIQASIEPDQYVYADERRITQVLYNFITNAVNHVGADKRIDVALRDMGGGARFEVADRGSGIDRDELPLIWDRYYKSQRGGTTKIGTGLGLSIAKEVLTAHGARFGAESAPGQGSVFWFELKK